MALVKYNNNSISAVTAAASIPSGSLVLIKSQTASSSASISFIHGTSDVVFDGTYDTYMFKFISIHPQTDSKHFSFNATTDGTNFNVTKTSSAFGPQHDESDSDANLNYRTGNDLQQSTADQRLASEVGADSDQSLSGSLFFFSPSSTVFVKHFLSNTNSGFAPNYSNEEFNGGYCNTTSAITGLKFLFNSGNIDSGTIKLHGIKDS